MVNSHLFKTMPFVPIPFELAKLAMEAGFNDYCLSGYSVWRGNIRKSETEEQALRSLDFCYPGPDEVEIELFYSNKDYIAAPSYAQIEEWLESKKYYFNTYYGDSNSSYSNDYPNRVSTVVNMRTINVKSKLELKGLAIKSALTEIIKQNGN